MTTIVHFVIFSSFLLHTMPFLSRSDDKKKLPSYKLVTTNESLAHLHRTAAIRSLEATLSTRDTTAAVAVARNKAKDPEEAILKISQDAVQ
jgi:hypothetical protein